MASSTVIFSLLFLFVFVFELTVSRPLTSLETDLIEEIEQESSKLRILKQLLEEVSWALLFLSRKKHIFLSVFGSHFIDYFSLGWKSKDSACEAKITKESDQDEQEQFESVLF